MKAKLTFVSLLIILFFTACKSAPKKTILTTQNLSLIEVEQMVANSMKPEDFLLKLGSPSEKFVENEAEIWIYYDPKTDAQRLNLTFDKSKSLKSVSWIPSYNEPESQLANVLARYPRVKFKPIDTRRAGHDVLSTETVYSDKESMSIFHSDATPRVEAIGWYKKSADSKLSQTKNELPVK